MSTIGLGQGGRIGRRNQQTGHPVDRPPRAGRRPGWRPPAARTPSPRARSAGSPRTGTAGRTSWRGPSTAGTSRTSPRKVMRSATPSSAARPLQVLQARAPARDLDPQVGRFARGNRRRTDQVGDILLGAEPGHRHDRSIRAWAVEGEPVDVDPVEDGAHPRTGDALLTTLCLDLLRDADVPVDQPREVPSRRHLAGSRTNIPPVTGVDDPGNAGQPGSRGGIEQRSAVVRVDRRPVSSGERAGELDDQARPQSRSSQRGHRPAQGLDVFRQPSPDTERNEPSGRIVRRSACRANSTSSFSWPPTSRPKVTWTTRKGWVEPGSIFKAKSCRDCEEKS